MATLLNMTPQNSEPTRSEKKEYVCPDVSEQGRVEDLTQWLGGRWGEFFNGQGSGWNPWTAVDYS